MSFEITKNEIELVKNASNMDLLDLYRQACVQHVSDKLFSPEWHETSTIKTAIMVELLARMDRK